MDLFAVNVLLNRLFLWQNNNLKREIFEWVVILATAEILQEAMYSILLSPTWAKSPEVESSRTFLASRTDFEVLGLGLSLEASSPRKLACPRLEDSTIFWIVKILWSAWKIFWKTFFCGDRLKNVCEDLFFCFWRSPEKFLWRPFLFWRAFALVSLVLGLGLEHSCPWPRECLSSERLSLALATDFFCGLGLEPCVLDSTSANH